MSCYKTLPFFLDHKENMNEEQQYKFEQFINNRVEKLIAQRTYNWKQIDFNNEHLCHQYLLTRIAPDYHVVQSIFNEIQQRDPDFAPQSLFDFGSGVGTVTMYVSMPFEIQILIYNLHVLNTVFYFIII